MNRRKFVLIGGGLAAATALNVAVVRMFRQRRRQLPVTAQNLNENGISAEEIDTDVCSIVFSSHGLTLASAGANGALSLWDPFAEKITSAVPASRGQKVTDIGFLSSETWLATTARGVPSIQVWNPKTMDRAMGVELRTEATALALSPELEEGVTPAPTLAAVGLADHSVGVFGYGLTYGMVTGTFNSFAPVAVLKDHVDTVNALAFSRDGSRLASASSDSTILLWDPRSWKRTNVFRVPKRSVRCVAFSRDGRRLCGGFDDGTIRVWDLPSGADFILRGGAQALTRVQFCSDPDWLISVTADRSIDIWSVNQEKRMRVASNPGKYAAIDISSDGELLASAWGDSVRFFRTEALMSQARNKFWG